MRRPPIELVDYWLIPQPGKRRFEYVIVWKETGEDIGYSFGRADAVRTIEEHKRQTKESKNGMASFPKRSIR